MVLYAGIDLHSNNNVVVVQDRDDTSDARWLAKLLRLGQLPEGHIYPRTKRIVALKAVAHKLGRACYHMIKEEVAFDLRRAFG